MTQRGALDQTFKSLNANLETTASPYDPIGESGDPNDSAVYLVRPGVNFIRPWLAIRNGPAFQWPLGLEGFSLTIDPTLGIHKFLGDNAVSVDVLHAGEEHFTMSGSFIGNSSPSLIRALRDVVYQGAPAEGKILFIPEVMAHAQRVQVAHFEVTRSADERGRDVSYSIEFVRMGQLNAINARTTPIVPSPQPTTGTSRPGAHFINVDAKHNTLRKIALWKFNDVSKWRTLFNANEKLFVKLSVPTAKAPDHRLPLGTRIDLG